MRRSSTERKDNSVLHIRIAMKQQASQSHAQTHTTTNTNTDEFAIRAHTHTNKLCSIHVDNIYF